MDTQIVIMAGGIGSRLWPASTPQMPKQFTDLLGVGKSLLQMTVDRFLPLCPTDGFWVVTSERYVDLVRDQLPGIPADQILAEPEPRNTAPCIAYACRKIAVRHPDANVVVTPADALVLNTGLFADTIRKALAFTESSDAIVTVGIRPTRPETGYGYIHAEESRLGEIVKVSEFREKPDLTTAEAYLQEGSYFWNAGIFVWNVRTISRELSSNAPGIQAVMDRIAPSFYTEGEKAALAEWFPTCESISIDYAVMEKSRSIHVIADDLLWSDLGSWGSIKTHLPADPNGNAAVGKDVRLFECKDCLVHVPGAETAVIQGLEGYAVVEAGGRLLVCKLSEEQRIKEFSQKNS